MLATQGAQPRQRTTKTTKTTHNKDKQPKGTTQPPIRDMYAMLQVHKQDNTEQPNPRTYAYVRHNKRYVRNVRGVQPTQGAQPKQRGTTHPNMYARQGAQTRQPV